MEITAHLNVMYLINISEVTYWFRLEKMNESSMKGSSSQRSVYDYPEHLNPFYEDENHKRLRFWKIGRPNRSNSFSIDGLKGLW